MFHKRVVESTFLDPANGFEKKTIPIEIRTDRFTQRVSRVLTDRMKFPEADLDTGLIEKSLRNCPFCPGNLETMTPKFPASMVPEGRIRFGKSTVFPNAFPYSRYGSVTVMSETHYVPLHRFADEPGILADAIKASRLYIDAVKSAVVGLSYASINWNFMPGAGGGLIHPHLQTIVTREPAAFHQKLLKASAQYSSGHGKNYWADLIDYEKENKSRYLFGCGGIEFLSCFSPGGMFGEILAVFTGITKYQQIGEPVWGDFVSGLSRIIGALSRQHLNNLNMTLMLSFDGDDHFWIQARVIPRLTLPPFGTSDVNFFEKGHGEIIVTVPPEALAGYVGDE